MPFLAWAAGIIDGEGCILIKEGVALRVVVNVENTDPRMLIELRLAFGGSIALRKGVSKSKRRPIWQWDISAKKAEAMLTAIRPYLICKGDQADIALAARAHTKPGGHGSDRVMQRVLKDQLALAKRKDFSGLSEIEHA